MTDQPTIKSWSFSRLMDWETCKFYAWLKHAKRIPDPKPSPAADRGTAIHTIAEDYVNGVGSDIVPVPLQKFDIEFRAMRNLKKQSPNQVIQELEWGFDTQWNPVPYKGAFGRVKSDLIKFNPDFTQGVVVDYKTGKKFGNEVKHGRQLEVYALSSFIMYPNLQVLDMEDWYLDLNEMLAIRNITREKALKVYMRVFDAKFREMTSATKFPPNPNVNSCKYCPYGDTGHCDKRVVDNQATQNFFKRMQARK